MRRPLRCPPRTEALAAASLLILSCASHPHAAVEERFAAVHNALFSLGLTPVGGVGHGVVSAGAPAHLPVELPASCVTLAATGGDGVLDLDLALRDTMGEVIAHDSTHEPEATLHTCLDKPGAYDVVVSVGSGRGAFVYEAWVGASLTGGDGGAAATAAGQGTCESPIPLTAGSVRGTMKDGESSSGGSCGGANGNEVVYRLDIATRSFIHLDVTPSRFDSIAYIRKADCTDQSAEVACNDDYHGNASHIDALLEPSTYYVFVDSTSETEQGTYRLKVVLDPVAPLADVCRVAPLLSNGVPVAGTTASSASYVEPLCKAVRHGSSGAYRFDVPVRARVRVEEQSSEFIPAFSIRQTCADALSEMACAVGEANRPATYNKVMTPGSYTVFASARDGQKDGRYSVTATVVTDAGVIVPGDTLADAIPLTPTHTTVTGDTLRAADDFTGKCSTPGGSDIAYHLDVARTSRLFASINSREGAFVLSLLQQTGVAPPVELSCGTSLNTVLPPGGYTLLADGANDEAFGRFTLNWRLRDLSGQAVACANAPLLADGQKVDSTTQGGADNFTTSCSGYEEQQDAHDKVYKIVVKAKSKVRLLLSTPTWDGTLALRRQCEDGTLATRNNELACNDDFGDSRHSKIETVLDAGTYFVVVDGHTGRPGGPFTLEYKLVH